MGRHRTDPYRYLTCGGCGRAIDQREHWGFPNEATDPRHVHLIVDSAAPAYGVHCPCSHYTLYADPENMPVGLPKGMRLSMAARVRAGDVGFTVPKRSEIDPV